MAEVSFHHPNPVFRTIGDLTIDVKPDQITWAYGLNTAVFPTYGGEVVQILSVFFDDMTVSGTVSTYAEMERIYGWFLVYMQYATQGRDHPSFDQRPVDFYYHERGWHFQIWPKSLPGFRYGRDVVAPTWTMVAAVKEPDATVTAQIKSYAQWEAFTKGDPIKTFGKTTADFGRTGDLIHNPWASPDADPTLKGQTMKQYLDKGTTQLADTFSGFVQDYQNFGGGGLNSLPQFQDISKAAKFETQTATGKSKKSSKVKK